MEPNEHACYLPLNIVQCHQDLFQDFTQRGGGQMLSTKIKARGRGASTNYLYVIRNE